MVEFLCLGSGSSGNSYFLRTENEGILIDAGICISTMEEILRDNGYSLQQVDAVFITHDHADHIKAVEHLAHMENMPIYATREVHVGINRNYCVHKKLTPVQQRLITKEETTVFGDFHITPFGVSHDSTDCVGYKVEVQGITFCLVTDCGEVTPSVERAISDANYLVLEANHEEAMLIKGTYPQHLKGRISGSRGHLSNRQCANALVNFATPKLRHVWLCHLSEDNNHPELARKTVSQILRNSGIIPGVEFNLDVLRRRTPSMVYQLV